VLSVYVENDRNGEKRKSDNWSIVDERRARIWEQARAHWIALARCRADYFPYSVDAVARLYFRYRKRTNKEVNGLAVELGDSARLPIEEKDE
jgi:hypothetical protein